MYDQHIILDFEMNPVVKKYTEARKWLYREIIEIGATKVNSKGEITDTFSCFVKPQFSSDVAGYITKLTGIKSTDVYRADSFAEAIQRFSEWIGSKKTRIYSWSNSDFLQIKNECAFKHVAFPLNMNRWMDFQVMYPRLMEIRQCKNLMSLREAAEWYGIPFDQKVAHCALYDAKVTTELVAPVLTGEYLSQRERLKNIIYNDAREEKAFGICLSDFCSSFFDQFASNDHSEPKYIQ